MINHLFFLGAGSLALLFYLSFSIQMPVELASALVFFVAAASMALPAVTREFHTVLGAFLVLETCVGAFYSCSGLMRSRFEKTLSSGRFCVRCDGLPLSVFTAEQQSCDACLLAPLLCSRWRERSGLLRCGSHMSWALPAASTPPRFKTRSPPVLVVNHENKLTGNARV